jgi:hypothetical protein
MMGKRVSFSEGMTMWKGLGTAFAAGVMLATGSAIWADDTVRLGGPSAENSIRGGTDTELVHARGGFYGGRGGFYGGGWNRGGWGGGWNRSFYGGGWGGGWNRGFYGGGFYGRGYGYGLGFYGSRYYSPYYSVGLYSRPYYGYSSYYYPSYYYYPCAGEDASTVTLQGQVPQFAASQQLPAPRQYGPMDYRYDGGPIQQVPLPGGDTNPAKRPGPGATIPLDGKLVSLPTGISGGFSPVTLTPPETRTSVAPSVPRVDYPAYGEQR